jgi:hypothetical protein
MQSRYYVTQLHRTFGVVIFAGNFLKKIRERLIASVQLLYTVVKHFVNIFREYICRILAALNKSKNQQTQPKSGLRVDALSHRLGLALALALACLSFVAP